jgi:hypothetical protein
MRRFMKNEYEEDDDNFEDFLESSDYKSLLNQQNALEGFNLHLQEKKISTNILETSIKVCEKDLFWKFYRVNTKINKIRVVYESFISLLRIEDE